MMTLLLAFIGVAKADVVEIGTGTSTTYQFPVNSLYNYSFTEMIYSAEEIGTAGTINSVAFHFNGANVLERTVVMYMKNVDRSAFASTTDYEDVTSADVVFTGTLASEALDGWVTLELDTPFDYDGFSNLMIALDDNTGSWSSRYFYYTTATNAGLCYYSDTYNPEPSSLGGYSGSKVLSSNRPNVQLDITAGGSTGGEDRLHVKYYAGEEEIIDRLDLGVRPVGAWMEPFNFIMYTEGPAYIVNVLDFTPSDGMFSVSGEELPFHVTRTQDANLIMATNGTEAGLIERQFVAITEGNRAAHIWPVTVELYAPEIPDVWEKACTEATTFPFIEVPATAHGTTLHNDYTLPFPEIPEGLDAVYKLVFEQDQILNAYVSAGENGKVALYREGFEGEGGPMADNYYTGPTIGGGGASGAGFEAQIGEGTSTLTYFPFHTLWNYSLAENLFLASELTEAGVTTAPMTSLSWYVSSTTCTTPQNGISIWMGNVSDAALTSTSHTTAGMTLVYTGANILPVEGWNEFEFNEGNFSWDGHSNILILCQRQNGSWQGSVSWQTHNPGFAATCYAYTDTAPGYDATTQTYSMSTSTTNRADIIMKSDRSRVNRDAVVFDFENQQIPAAWTNDATYPWTVVSENGSYCMKSSNGGVASSTSTISATFDMATDGTISFDALCMGEGTSTIWDKCIFNLDGVQQFSYGANIAGWNNYTYEVTAGSHTCTWSYSKDSSVNPTGDAFFVDNVTITTAGAPVPPPELDYSFGPVITDMPVEAGTYYLVASSTDANFEVTINAEAMPCPDVEDFAFNPTPADDEDGIEPASVTLRWNIPTFATGWRIIFGTTYHPEPDDPQTVMYPTNEAGEWVWSTSLANSYTVRNLWNNTNYFWRVEFNNSGSCPEGVSSPIWGFTTHLNIPQNLTAVDYTVFNDETIVLNWNAIADRTFRTYFIYRDGVKIGETNTNQVNATSYTDGPLAYNMGGYTYYVTAVYDEGESAPSDPVTVKVSGYSDVNGHVYEQDGTTGIAGATVTMTGLDEFNVSHTYNFTTNNQGYYSGHIYAGSYNGQAAKDGYQTIYEPVQGNPIEMAFNQTISPIDYILDENFDPVCSVLAEYYPDSTYDYVKVSWGCGLPGEEIIEPFETGDFSLFDWQIDPTYPWSITTTNPYEGQYCMKSGGAGVASVTSNMTVTVNIPADGLMSFWCKISSESNYDYGHFYIDGVEKVQLSGAGNWVEKTYDVTAGDHTFKWSYTKDSSVNSNDDCFYVDYITFYKRPEPPVPGMTYDFEDGTMQGWTSVDADGDGYGWYMGSEIMTGQTGNNGSSDFVLSQSYYMGTVLYPDNYLVSPQVQLGGIVRFYACAQDASYAAEHFGLAVSTTNTNPSSFTMVQEWTMTAKSVGEPGKPIKGQRSGRAQGNWYEYTVDLSAYSGMGYVAIRHFNCSDMFYLNVDDITIGEPGKSLPTPNRSLSHYRVYRTNCYNDGPYTEENTVLLATVWVPDTVYIDVNWPDVAPGVYKWGVGSVYAGNRGEEIEGPISWAEPVVVNPTADNAPNPVVVEDRGNRAPWDLLHTFNAAEAGHYGVVSDGNYIYTSNWGYSSAANNFYKYDMQGNMIEGFNISGCGTLRGMTFDGQYVYGVANSSTVYCVDLNNHTLVSTFTSAYGAMRCISYDPERDGFWVVGNWSGNLTLINRQGAIVTTGPAPTSASDVAYYKDENNAEHVFCFDNGTNLVWDYDIASNTIVGSVFDFSVTPGFNGGTSGGCHVGEYDGKVAFFGDIQQSPNLIGIYELRNSGVTPGPTPGPGTNNLNQLALPRESETIWSNCLDKDMYLTNDVTINVLLNSADSPEGVQVSFTNYNEYEQQTYGGYNVTLDESGYYAFESFRKGEYKVNVTFDGYEPIEDSVSIWEPTDLRYVMTEILYGVDNIYVSRTGWAMWDDSAIPGPTPGPNAGDEFTVDFEGGLPADWTVIDGNNDGYTWCLTSAIPTTWTYYASLTLDWYHNGTNAICSGSYINGVGAINPDEYLVSPQVTLAGGSQLSFWVAATDASYPADHFGVFVSDNGTSDWTSVQEWTLTGKKEGMAGGAASRDGRGLRLGTWYNYTVDLSAYAGQKYIAFRHFNCYDQYIMCLDDIALTAGAKSGDDRHLEYYKVLCTSIDGVPIFNHNTVHPFCQLSTDEPYNAPLIEGDHYLCKVAVMYSTGMSAWSDPVEWVYEPCDHWGPVDEVTVNTISQGNHIQWVFEHGYNPYDPGTGPVPPQPGQGDWYYYDNGINVDAIGLTAGGSFYWGVMFPAGSYTGNMVTKVSMYDYSAHTGNILVYQGGTNAPGTLVGQQAYSCTGSEDFVEWEFTSPVTIDPTQNLWIVMNNNNGQYVASMCDYTGDPNGTMISIDGTDWSPLAEATGGAITGTWMIRAYVADGAKGEPKAISYNGKSSNGGTLAISGQGPRVKNANVDFVMTSDNTLEFNIASVANYDGRVYFLHKLYNDSRFSVINAEQSGMFIVSNDGNNLKESFSDFVEQTMSSFARMDKYAAADYANQYKGTLPMTFVNSMMMDIYAKSRDNAHCADAFPFCTDNGMYEFPAGVNAGSGETGPDYDCLYTTPNPAWYYMKMSDPGDMDIYMYSTPSVDIDFCCWGPFDDPISPCPNGLTEDKVVSCSYSAQPTEHCMIPATAQTGEYYILVITNYSNQACNINFSKVGGSGSTDCTIVVPTVDLIGFLITQDGEYLAFVGPDEREYTDIDEFGTHEYCVRPIYPGEMVLPDHNYGWSMGCPVCESSNGGGQITCEPGAPIHAEELHGTDQVKVWWGDAPLPPVPPMEDWIYYDDGTYATSIGAGAPIYWGSMFPSASLAPYAGTNLTKVALYENSYNTSTVTVNIYLGGTTAPQTLVSTMTYTPVGGDAFHEVNLTTPVAIDGTQNLWIVFLEDGQYPANACADTGEPNNRWVSLDGVEWMDVAEAGVPGYGWMIRGFVTNQGKGGMVENIALEPMKPSTVETSGMTLSHSEVVSRPADLSFMSRSEIVSYNVKRSDDNINYTLIGNVPAVAGQTYYEYIDTPEAAGTYYYQVTAVYDDGCESAPALAADDPTHNYVSANVDAIGENSDKVALYPNPTSGNVTIEAAGMSRITVVSVLGQVVYDTEVNADNYTLNMAQFNAGMYMVRVYTEEGVTVKRVTVMR